jgi:CheY-like chemotaxis protein
MAGMICDHVSAGLKMESVLMADQTNSDTQIQTLRKIAFHHHITCFNFICVLTSITNSSHLFTHKGSKMKLSHAVKVLIIDDEPSILRMLSIALSRKGYVIDTALNGTQGIEKIIANDYDLILTDILMPDISGSQVSRELRKIKGNVTPIVGMSGTPWLLDRDLFDDVLPKPCSLKELFDVIGKVAPVPL